MITRRAVSLGILGVTGAAVLAGSLAGNAPAPAMAVKADVSPPPDDALPRVVIGDPSAPVLITGFMSFTCSHCARFEAEIMPQLKAEYIETGKARFSFAEVYMDRAGLLGGMLAWTISRARTDPEKYAEFTRDLFARQTEWAFAPKTTSEAVAAIAAVASPRWITAAEAEATIADQALAERLVADFAASSLREKIQGTPSFIVGDTLYTNLDMPGFRRAILAV